MSVRIAISMGDPLGIGPEIIIKALQAPLAGVHHLVFGALSAFWQAAEQLGCVLPQRAAEWIDIAAGDLEPEALRVRAGELQVRSLEAAFAAVRAGQADALCTAPITKARARAAGFPFPGHTEYLAQNCGVDRWAMMLAGPSLRVVPLTGHLPLREVPSRLTPRLVADGAVVTAAALQREFGLTRPRIGVAGLNPHAGEQGMLGDEEQLCLMPGLDRARAELAERDLHAELVGPIPADALFVPPVAFDAVLCCYHDQALIPLKMLHRDDAVNVTLGLPIVRTSPAHGTALDIAGQGRAKPDSLRAALRMAQELVCRRRESSPSC